MSGDVNIFVEAANITDAQLISHHIGQYFNGTGFNDVTVNMADPAQFPEPSSQTEALQAIRRLNPGLFDATISIEPSVASWNGSPVPDGPDEE